MKINLSYSLICDLLAESVSFRGYIARMLIDNDNEDDIQKLKDEVWGEVMAADNKIFAIREVHNIINRTSICSLRLFQR